jgi:phosphohistidine phosphatase
MKKILIMRHAKSDWSDSSLADFDRPLNKRGKKAAPFMGKEIYNRKLVPDLVLSSPAQRAKLTAEAVAKECNIEEKIQWKEDFYFGYADDIIETLQRLPKKIHKVLIIGHNPTLENLVSILVNDYKHVTMPTAALVSLSVDIDNWTKLESNSCLFDWILRPKELKRQKKASNN